MALAIIVLTNQAAKIIFPMVNSFSNTISRNAVSFHNLSKKSSTAVHAKLRSIQVIFANPFSPSISNPSPVLNNGPSFLTPSSSPEVAKVFITSKICFPKSINLPPKSLISSIIGKD